MHNSWLLFGSSCHYIQSFKKESDPSIKADTLVPREPKPWWSLELLA